jgi:adenylosuccinate synthase
VLLDEWRGWHPYTTWSTTTFDNVTELCGPKGFLRLGVVRSYTTRHGAGPFVTEAPLDLPEPHNGVGEWQGAFRVGHFDAVAHRYAVEVAGGIDALAVTHLDSVGPGLTAGLDLTAGPSLSGGSDLSAGLDLSAGSELSGGSKHAVGPKPRICTAYEVDGVRWDRIVPGPYRDLEYQAQLTAALSRAVPGEMYEPSDWVSAISSELGGTPVVIESYGPRTADKRFSASFRSGLAPDPHRAGRPYVQVVPPQHAVRALGVEKRVESGRVLGAEPALDTVAQATQ